MKYSIFSSVILLLALTSQALAAWNSPFSQVAQRYEEQSAVESAAPEPPAPYKFSYNTGSGSASDASHFREESRDENGVVVGKYGYVDAYGKLRVVTYTAGPQGFVASGDIGPDQEALRQQRELYSADASYQQQQQAWQQAASGQQQQAAQQWYNSNAASAASSASSSSHGGSEWTSVNDATVGSSGAYTSGTKGSRFSERYVAAGGTKSPVAQYREQQTIVSSVQPVQTVQTSAVKSIKSSQSSSSSSAAAAASAAAASSAYTAPAPAPAVSQTIYTTKTVQQPVVQTARYSYSYQLPPVVQPARIIQSTKGLKQQQQTVYSTGYQSPAARLVSLNQGSSSSSSSASAAAAASASAASSSGAYTAGVKGYSGAIKSAPLKVARYTDSVPSGRGHTVVNFQQGGPVPYKYSYSY